MSASDDEVIVACSDSDNESTSHQQDRQTRIMEIEKRCRTGWTPFIATSVIKSIVDVNPWSRKRKRTPIEPQLTTYFTSSKVRSTPTLEGKRPRSMVPSQVQETLSSSFDVQEPHTNTAAGVRKIDFEQRTQTQSSGEKYTFNYATKPEKTHISGQANEELPGLAPEMLACSKSEPTVPQSIPNPSNPSNSSFATPAILSRDTQSELASAKRDLAAALEASPIFQSYREDTDLNLEGSHVIVPETSILEAANESAVLSVSADILPDESMQFAQMRSPQTPEHKRSSPRKSLFAFSSPITFTPFAADIGSPASLSDIQQYLKRTNFDLRSEAQKLLEQD